MPKVSFIPNGELEIVKNSTKEIHNFLGISEAILSV